MFRDLYNKSKEVAEKVANVIMNYTEIETKVREATSDEAWGASGSLMLQIADYTYTYSSYREVMDVLYKRLQPINNSSWRRVYKSLVLLDFLLKNGSEHVLAGTREHIYDLRSLESFQYRDEHGRDHGINVRIKAQDIIKLLQDDEYLKQERAKAKALRHKQGQTIGSMRYSSWSDSYASRTTSSHSDEATAYDRHEDWQSGPIGTRSISSNDSKLTVNPRLGSFDDWNVGRERGFVDDVVEQIKEAWDLAKLSTRSALNKTVHQPDPYESNPRMISEELYAFPESTAEAGAIANFDQDGQLPPPVKRPTGSNGTRQLQQQHTSTAVSSQQASNGAAATANVSEQLQPPVIDLFGSWNDNTAEKPGRSDTSLWPDGNDRSDAGEFGEFVSARPPPIPKPAPFPSPATGGFVQQPVSQTGAGNDDLFAVFQSSGTAVQDWPLEASSASLWTNSIQPTPITPSSVHPSGGASSISNSNFKATPLASTSNGPVPTGASCPEVSSPKPSQPVGSSGLWKDIDSLGINLDTIACPTRTTGRNTGPSLRQLQQQHQPKASPTGDLFSRPPTVQLPPTSRMSS